MYKYNIKYFETSACFYFFFCQGPVCVRLGLTVKTARCLSGPPPEVEGVVSALCDLNQGPCPFFLVQGFGFLDYPSLTCHFTLAENNVSVELLSVSETFLI